MSQRDKPSLVTGPLAPDRRAEEAIVPMTIAHHTFPSSHFSARSAVWAGLAAGLVFLLLELALPLLMGASPWAPPRMIAAIAMGRHVLPPPDTFDAGIVGVGALVHFALSLIYAFVFAFGLSLVPRGLKPGVATLLGAAFGLVLYVVNFYGFTAWFPWFAEARNGISVFTHLAFGAVLGATYAGCARHTERTGQ